jgi:hypothetical protein
MFRWLLAPAACAALVSLPASAVTVDISRTVGFEGSVFNVLEQTVVLPAGFTDALITITRTLADDSAVLQVNGTNVVGWGIFGPGDGSFAFSAQGPFVPFYFGRGNDNVQQTFSAPFVAGANTITVFNNDTHNGIVGGQFSVGFLTRVDLGASLTYSVPTAPVPEPEAALMLLAGTGLVAGVVRRRARVAHAAASAPMEA